MSSRASAKDLRGVPANAVKRRHREGGGMAREYHCGSKASITKADLEAVERMTVE